MKNKKNSGFETLVNRNVEIKPRTKNNDSIRNYLKSHGADGKGVEHQIDTYFNVSNGRLKIREGTCESCIVHYSRPDECRPKKCEYSLIWFDTGDPKLEEFKRILTDSLGILTIVDKIREVYYIDSVSFDDPAKSLSPDF